jgi:DNA-binding transcriptional LysR family regulator
MLPAGDGPFETLELMRDPYVVVLPADSPLAQRPKPPSLREVAAMPLIGNRQCRSVHQIENRFRDAGLEPRVVFRSDDNGTIQELVAAGVGIALVPLLTVDPAHDGTAVIGLPAVPPRRIGVAWHRDRYRSPAARAFVEVAREICAQVEADQSGSAAAA